jgi:hypothetical protein
MFNSFSSTHSDFYPPTNINDGQDSSSRTHNLSSRKILSRISSGDSTKIYSGKSSKPISNNKDGIFLVTIFGVPLNLEKEEFISWLHKEGSPEINFANFRFSEKNVKRPNTKNCLLNTNQEGVDLILRLKRKRLGANILTMYVRPAKDIEKTATKFSSEVNFGNPARVGFPPSNPFYAQVEITPHSVLEFLNLYYNIYDADNKDDRQQLLEAYAPEAKLTFIRVHSNGSGRPRLLLVLFARIKMSACRTFAIT